MEVESQVVVFDDAPKLMVAVECRGGGCTRHSHRMRELVPGSVPAERRDSTVRIARVRLVHGFAVEKEM